MSSESKLLISMLLKINYYKKNERKHANAWDKNGAERCNQALLIAKLLIFKKGMQTNKIYASRIVPTSETQLKLTNLLIRNIEKLVHWHNKVWHTSINQTIKKMNKKRGRQLYEIINQEQNQAVKPNY